jgi:hypothetical protein
MLYQTIRRYETHSGTVKRKVFPVHVMTEYKASRGIAPFILNLGTI